MTMTTPTVRRNSKTATAIKTGLPENSCVDHWTRIRHRNIRRRAASQVGESLSEHWAASHQTCLYHTSRSANNIHPMLPASKCPRSKVPVVTKQGSTSIDDPARSQSWGGVRGHTESPCNPWSPFWRHRLHA